MGSSAALRKTVARALARALLTCAWHPRPLMARADHVLGAGGPWLRTLIFDLVQRWPVAPVARAATLGAFLDGHPEFTAAWARREIAHVVPGLHPFSTSMAPGPWPVRPLAVLHDVETWLGLDAGQLEWLADRRGFGLGTKAPRLHHYGATWVTRAGRLPRLLEAPKARLKQVQRRILDEVLAAIPPHDAAHGFVPGRSVLTHARLHVGREVVIRLDLEQFFTSVRTPRLQALLLAAGYPDEVATTLLALCTTRTPESVLRAAPLAGSDGETLSRQFFQKRQLAGWHLPQGAPSSPALANLSAFGLDVRLAALAAGWDATYSRYADDLVFSGGERLRRRSHVLLRTIDAVVRGEGFHLNARKTRIMGKGGRQAVTGLVVNEAPAVERRRYEHLKAVLHRGVVAGPGAMVLPGQGDLRARLQGSVAWVEHVSPRRGQTLRALFERIDWPRAG